MAQEVGRSRSSSYQVGFERRIGQVESGLASATTEIHALRSDISDIKEALTGVSHQISQGQRTPWGILLAGGALVLSVVGLVGSIYVREQDTTTASIHKRLDIVEERMTNARETLAQDRHWGDDIDRIDAELRKIDRRQGYNEKAIESLESDHMRWRDNGALK